MVYLSIQLSKQLSQNQSYQGFEDFNQSSLRERYFLNRADDTVSISDPTKILGLEVQPKKLIGKRGNFIMAVNTETLAKGLQTTFGEIVETRVNAVKARELVEAVLEEIGDLIAKGEKVSLTGFGDFEKKETKARMGRSPQTGEAVPIPASYRPSFKPKKGLKDKVKGK